MKKNVTLATFAGCITGFALATLTQSSLSIAFADTPPVNQPTTITVVGHSDQIVQPDIALVDAGVTTKEPTATLALEENKKLTSTIISALLGAGVSNSDIQAQWYSLSPNYEPTSKPGPPMMDGFQVSDNFTIEIRDLTKIGNIVDTLAKSGITQINGVNYQVSDIIQLQKQGFSGALSDAQAQAANIAQSLGLTISGIQSVNTETTDPTPMGKGMSNSFDTLTPAPNSQDISTNVQVVFTANPSK